MFIQGSYIYSTTNLALADIAEISINSFYENMIISHRI